MALTQFFTVCEMSEYISMGQDIFLVSSKMNRWFYDLVIVLPKEELIVHLSRKADAKKNIVYLNQTHTHVEVQFILGLKLFHF